jgi:NADPH:quinone reductase-like Zn-dependent oxidoreductase
MYAARIHRYGALDEVVVEECAEPVAGAGELVVRVAAAGVNPVDWKIASGGMRQVLPIEFPYTLGCDFAGVVEMVGGGVSGFVAGDAVFGYPSLLRSGAFAEKLRVGVGEIAKVPEGVSLEQAAALPVASITAHDGLVTHGKLTAGESVLVLGGAGGVGSAAVQLAVHLGARVYATASGRNREYVESLGATVIDYGSQRTEDVVRDVDLLLDCVGPEAGAAALGSLRRGGRFVTTVYALPPAGLFEALEVVPKLFGILPSAERLESIRPLAAAGKLVLHLDGRFGLQEARVALERSMAGRTRGKLLILP